MEMETKNEVTQERRKRKKKLYNDIKEQMEFYFSDSNLLRDKFLLNLLDQTEDGFIDLDVFLTFNKIRALTTNVSGIIKAVSSSDILQVNEEKTKIRRVTAINLPTNVDDNTVYVENIPHNVDHAWLKNIFSSFGQVTYISIPKFKTSGQNKGFAFVEFSDPDATQRACVHFGATSPTYEKTNENRLESSVAQGTYIEPNVKIEKACVSAENFTVKQEPETADPSQEQLQPEQDVPEESYANSNPTGKQKKKRRRRNKSKKSEPLNLYIVSKKEWKQLKAKYLSLQKENMAQMKLSLGLHFKEEKLEQKEPVSADFIPGVIVKLSLNSPLSNAKTFKDSIINFTSVAYVDTSSSINSVYIRCFNTEDANNLAKSDLLTQQGSSQILKGEEEENYWKKLQEDRIKKQQTKTRDKRRGRDKLISRAEILVSGPKHTYFPD